MINSSIASIDRLIELGEFEKAESECVGLLDKDEKNAQAFCKLGEIYLSQEKEVEAQIFFEKALKLDDNNYCSIINLAVLYKNILGKQKVEQFLWEIINTSYKNIEVMISLALESEKMQKYDITEIICNLINTKIPNNIAVNEILIRVKNYYSLFYVVHPQVISESELGKHLSELVDSYKPKVVLDIGAATGLGSTKLLAESVLKLNSDSKIYAVEAQKDTFNILKNSISKYSFVEPVWGTFINKRTVPNWEIVSSDIKTYGLLLLESYSENEIKNWYENSVSIINGLSQNQKAAKEIINEEIFDLVFFDSGEFFAKEEMKEFVNKSNIIVLDDINTYKNSFNHQYLSNNPEWVLIKCDTNERNGWSAFKRKEFLVRENIIKSETIKSVYVSQEVEVFYDENASGFLEKNNDKKYLTDKGIVQVDKSRWFTAQKYERKTWMERSLGDSDDRNFEHRTRFNNYDSLRNGKFEEVIELGCGPFTNLRLVLPLIQSIKSVTLLDPLITDYLRHPNCTYKNGTLAGYNVQTISSTIEEFIPDEKYDLVVMNNVLEHCYNIPKIFEVLTSMLNEGGVFIFADVAFDTETVNQLVEKQYDAGHPIRLNENFLKEFLSKHFDVIYEKEFLGLYDQPYRKDFYFIGKHKSITNSQTQLSSIHKSPNSPVIHFVYSGDPKNDAAISAPQTITNKLYRFFEKHLPVTYYNLDDVNTVINVGVNDIVIGHPHPQNNTAIRRLFSQHAAAKFLLWPFHSALPEINHYVLDLAEYANNLFMISGPYWTDNVDKTEFAQWENKIVRLDNAVDANIFRLSKKTFNGKGNRGLFVLGRSGKEKGTTRLFELLARTNYRILIAGEYSADDLAIIRNRNNITLLGSISWLDTSTVNKIVSECDFFINMSFSDASPTTLLEAMAVGLIPITTPQCGYYYQSLIMLSDDDVVNHNIIKHAQSMSEEYLKELQNNNRNIIEQRHNWNNITQQIWEKMLPFLKKSTRQINTKKVKIAGDDERYLDLTKIDDHSSFAENIKKIFEEKLPKKIIETGTYHGTGTTTIIAQTLKCLNIEGPKFYSIEVNPENHKKAKSNLAESGLLKYVSLLNGVSVPRSILPDQTEIIKTTVNSIEYDDIFVDHKENERVQLYFNETNFPEVPEDLLGKTLKEFDYRPDFVLLDSAGHMGFIEFQYLLSQIKGNCIIALDDIYHIKHHKSFRFMQTDPRFNILVSSKEKFGFCVAEFTYDSRLVEHGNLTKVDDKEIINCLLCSSDKSTIVHPPDIVKCDDCGFIYLKIRPTQKWMENYYKEVYAVNDPSAAVTVAVPSDVSLLDINNEFIAAQRRSLFEEAIEHYGKTIQGGTLIDIGCGWGALLYNARKYGMNVIGFEFTNHNVQFARQVLNLDVRQQQFADSDIPENSVDIVTMSHVLEHVPDPLKVVEKINRVLKPGGIFYCVVPNFYSLCSAYLGEKWEWLDRNWHYSQFSVDSIQKLFLKVGLNVEQISTTTGDYGNSIPTQLLRKKFPDKSNHELQVILEGMNKQNYGEEIRIIGKKIGNEVPPKQNQNDKNILWIRTDAIGDNILASSMLKPLKTTYRDYKITVVCQNVVRELYETSPYVDKIISLDTKKIIFDKKYRTEILSELQALNAEYAFNSIYSRDLLSDYLTINSFAKNKIAHLGDLSNILKEQKEENNKHYTKLIETNPSSFTELERHSDFLTGINVGSYKLEATLWLNEEDTSYAENVFSMSHLKSEKTLVLFAGAQHEVRIFNDYGKAVNEFCAQNGFDVIVLGSNKDEQVNKLNIKDLTGRVVDLTGKTTLRQSAAIMKKCSLAVGAETGLAHIACAIGIPNLILLGGGHFGRFMPYSRFTSVVSLPLECFGCNWQCKYGTTTCIKDIDHKVISKALESMLKDKHEKTMVYLQSDYKYDFVKNLPKMAGIEHLLKGDYETKIVEPTSTEVSLNFLEALTTIKDQKIYSTICELNELFIKNGKEVKAYAPVEQKLLTQRTKLRSLLNSIHESFHGDPFYNYLMGLLYESDGKTEASYEHYFTTVRTTENLRALYRLAHIAENNIHAPYVVYLFQELQRRGVEANKMLKKANYWIDLLSIKSINKLSPISENLMEPVLTQTGTKTDEDSPLVSIVLPSKNRADGLIAFLNSLEAASYGINYEVLLYAGDEIDEKYEKLIAQYKIKKVFLDKEIFKSGQSFSWSNLMNHGFSHSDGEWVMYASDDIVLHPFAINFALQYAKSKMVGGISFMHRNTVQDYDGFFKEYGYDVYGERSFINFGLIKKETFQLVKGFDEELKFYAADTDICWRIIEKGYKIIPSYYSLVEHINIEDATKIANSGKTYRTDTFAFYKKWFRDISRFGDKTIIRERFTIPDIKKIKKYIYETSIKNNISVTNILSIDNEYEQFIVSHQEQEEKQIKVSAIVSTYNSEKFIKGCLEDLVAQSLYKAGELEIVVIDSGSNECEGKIIEAFQKEYKNIYYARTEKETIYSAWNRGIRLAKGKYITNANTDDRHTELAFEKMAAVLDADESIGVLYADIYKTVIPNDSLTSSSEKSIIKWLDFDSDLLLFGCYIGPQPMWRKSIHDNYGLFNESLNVVGDYEFWLRLSKEVKFYHLKEVLGLYLYSENSAEHRDKTTTKSEDEKIREYYFAKNIATQNDLKRIAAKIEIIGKVEEFKEYYTKARGLIILRQNGLELEEKINEVIDKSNSLTVEESIKVFKQLIEILENSEILLDRDKYLSVLNSMLGNSFLKINLFGESKTVYENALLLNPNSSEACYGLGEHFLLEDNLEAAKTMLEWAVKNDPNNQSARTSLEKVNQELGFPADNNSHNKQKSVDIQIEELFAETYSLYQKKLFNDSLTVLIELEKFIDACPDEIKPETAASVFNLSGFNYLALGENDLARQSFEKSLNILPDSSTACVGLGEIFYLEGKDKEAKTMYEWAVKNNPANEMAVKGLNKINEVLGMERNDNSLNASPNIDEQVETLFSETYSLYEKKMYKEALIVLLELEKFVTNSSEEIHPDTLVSIINLSGYNYLGLNDIDNARESFERALNINPSSSSACAGLGGIYTIFAMDAEAKTMFEWAVKNNPENQTAVSSLASVNRRLGFSQNHNSLVIKNINPLRTIENKLDLAEELIDQDRNEEAEKLLQEVLAAEPTNVIALNNLSVIEIMSERYEEAVKLISKVLAINQEDEIALGNMNFIKEKLISVMEQV